MKICLQCKQLKSPVEFGKDKSKKDKLNIYCKKCSCDQSKRSYKENKESWKESNKKSELKWRKANPERARECDREENRRYRQRHPERVKQQDHTDYLKHKESYDLWAKKWAKNNPEKDRECQRRYHANHIEKDKAAVIKSNLKRKYRVPNFGQEGIKEFYMNCPKGYDVDHIIPLNGKTVSGLHVIWNLQYLTREENNKKGNKYDGNANRSFFQNNN